MSFVYSHRSICPTCEGRQRIVCCSVDDNTECQTMECPTCEGIGYLVDKKNLFFKVAIVIGVGALGFGVLIGAAVTGFFM